MTMNDKQGVQDDTVSKNTPLDDYDHIQIDQEAIDAEIQGREQFERRPVPEYYRRPVRRTAPVSMTLFNVDSPENLKYVILFTEL